jgi:hypothetical protein
LLVAVTFAPTTAAPLGSITVPAMAPASIDWACATGTPLIPGKMVLNKKSNDAVVAKADICIRENRIEIPPNLSG